MDPDSITITFKSPDAVYDAFQRYKDELQAHMQDQTLREEQLVNMEEMLDRYLRHNEQISVTFSLSQSPVINQR